MDYLSDVEVRVLGALIEKDITTPDYYPLSLNALVNACNQKNNRDPVMALDEDAVRAALESLQRQRLAGPASGAEGRVTSMRPAAGSVQLRSAGDCDFVRAAAARGQTLGSCGAGRSVCIDSKSWRTCMRLWTG